MIELVVFDIAGTTVHDGDAVNTCLRKALRAHGVDVDPQAVNAVMGLHKPEAIGLLLNQAGRQASSEAIEAIHDDFTALMQAYYASDPEVYEIAGTSTVFARLRQAGLKLALNTGFSRPIVDTLLLRLGWSVPEVIDAVICSDEVPRGRPHPDMIHTLMAQLGVTDPQRVAKVGDTAADLLEGTNARCGMVIGVTSGTSTAQQLQTLPHTHLLPSVADLPALLRPDEKPPS